MHSRRTLYSFLLILSLLFSPFGFIPSSVAQATVTPTGNAPTLFVPTPGTKLTGNVITFKWTNVGAASYAMLVGSTSGGSDIAKYTNILTNYKTVYKLPVDGRTLYVRVIAVYTNGTTAWKESVYKAYTLSTATTTVAPAVGPAPSTGSTSSVTVNTNSAQAFRTSAGVEVRWPIDGAASYKIAVGPVVASPDYLWVEYTTGHSAVSTKVPAAATKLWLRVFSSNAASAKDYELTIGTAPVTTTDPISSPTPTPTPSPAPAPEPVPTPAPSPSPTPTPVPTVGAYQPRGVGGGGAMAGYAVNPWNPAIRFVGTDMRTLLRSGDSGASWLPVAHDQTYFEGLLEDALAPGFNPDTSIVFHAPGGRNPVRSTDTGVTFNPISMPLQSGEKIRYWLSSNQNGLLVFAGTTSSLLRSADRGVTWTRVSSITGAAKGMFIDSTTNTVYHATSNAIYRSTDGGTSFSSWYAPAGLQIRSFAGGRSTDVTLSFIKNDPNKTSAGNVWVYRPSSGWQQTSQVAGDFLGMAENDSSTIYAVGSRNWANAYGTKVWVSKDAGATWALKLHQYNWDVNPYKVWDNMEKVGVGIDVGWWDSGYYTFHVNQRNSSLAGGSGNFFLYTTDNKGEYWDAPFSQSADGSTAPQSRWKTQGIEVTSIRAVTFHPKNPNVVFAGSMDIHGYISEDHGVTWRIVNPSIAPNGGTNQYLNAIYDVAFDPNNENIMYIAAGSEHDWPFSGHEGTRNSTAGGIFKTTDKGRTWKQLTPSIGTNAKLGVQYLSIAYDAVSKIIYAGRQGFGVIRSLDEGATWQEVNAGFGGSNGSNLIIPEIKIDPVTRDVYALLSGDFPNFTNRAYTGIYSFDFDPANPNKVPSWKLLRGTIETPKDDWANDGISADRTLGASGTDYPWWYPTTFTIDWNDPNRKTMYLGDKEINGAYMWSGVWKTTDGGATWKRLKQWPNVLGITIDPANNQRIYVAGDDFDGSEVKGKKWGLWYSLDGGATFKITPNLPLKHNVYSSTIDPSNAKNMWITFFGGGMMVGPKPEI